MLATRRFGLLICLMFCIQAAAEQPAFVVRRPTILAFFPPADQNELERDIDMATVLDDFQFYAGKVREPFAKRGIDFKQVYASSFRVSSSGKTTTFRPSGIKVGYYFIAPGKAPSIKYGVMTDADLLQVAAEYFAVRSR